MVKVTKSLCGGPNGSDNGSVRITDRVPTGATVFAGSNPDIVACSGKRLTVAPARSVLNITTGFPS